MSPEDNPLYADLIAWLKPQGFGFFKVMPDESLSCIHRFVFTWGLVTHVDWNEPFRDRWCYENLGDALLGLALFTGQGDPAGPWLKYKGRGPERYNPLMFRLENGLYKRLPPEDINTVALWPRGL